MATGDAVKVGHTNQNLWAYDGPIAPVQETPLRGICMHSKVLS